MQAFTALYAALDGTTSSNAKRDAIAGYLHAALPADAAWAVYVLAGGKLKRLASATELRAALADISGYPAWLIDDSYQHVGDLAETIALMAPPGDGSLRDVPLHEWLDARLPALSKLDSAARIAQLCAWWRQLWAQQVFVLNKLITGAFRVGVSRRVVVQALAAWSGHATDLIAHRLGGDWQPTPAALAALGAAESASEHLGDRPYPFFLASPLEQPVKQLGTPAEWQAEWKWDGIRAQLMRRERIGLWSRGEERLDGRFPELEQAALWLSPGVVLDGEILAWDASAQMPRPFTALQKRIGKLKPGAKLLADTPVCFMAYDLLERNGKDLREVPLQTRREWLDQLLQDAPPALMSSPLIDLADWSSLAALREQSRARQTEGLMLKRRQSPYRVGRKRGDWWKWKVEPYTVDAVLMYAQAGHGRRSGLFTDYTFGVWQDDALVPVAKAYSGLDDKEIASLDRWIRAHTTEHFGPVRAVQAQQVFELAFEAIQASSRHKAGIAVRFPRILRWRTDLGIHDAESLAELQRLAAG